MFLSRSPLGSRRVSNSFGGSAPMGHASMPSCPVFSSVRHMAQHLAASTRWASGCIPARGLSRQRARAEAAGHWPVAFGGGVAGFLGTLKGRHFDWRLAGALASAAPAGCLWIATCMGAAFVDASVTRDSMLSDGLLVCSGIILIGVCLGAALDRALRGGRPIVPGVRRLATIINKVTNSLAEVSSRPG